MQFFPLFLLAFFACALPALAQDRAPASDAGARIYKAHSDALYQIQVIDRASGKKTSIGSGFQFSADGLVGTNYHVIAGALQRPEENKLEYLKESGLRGDLSVVYADVINDVAIVRLDKPGPVVLQLGSSALPKGERIFSMGNPHDIGLTLTEGTFNGLSNESFIDKIHFSGALNSGMSGGPALDNQGRVIGINVATSGNQIGFLMPVERLKELIARHEQDRKTGGDFMTSQRKIIEEQVASHQSRIMKMLLSAEWEKVPFGPFLAPGRIHAGFKCWGGAEHRDDDPYTLFRSSCASRDRLFIDNELTTGLMSYTLSAVAARPDKMIATRFFDLYSQIFSAPFDRFNNAQEDDVTNFSCENSFVAAAGTTWKTSLCFRKYKKYPSLIDAYLAAATTGTEKSGHILNISLQGVTAQDALAFSKKMLESLSAAPAKPVNAAARIKAAP
jgi:S1-C subfamily serine protease